MILLTECCVVVEPARRPIRVGHKQRLVHCQKPGGFLFLDLLLAQLFQLLSAFLILRIQLQ